MYCTIPLMFIVKLPTVCHKHGSGLAQWVLRYFSHWGHIEPTGATQGLIFSHSKIENYSLSYDMLTNYANASWLFFPRIIRFLEVIWKMTAIHRARYMCYSLHWQLNQIQKCASISFGWICWQWNMNTCYNETHIRTYLRHLLSWDFGTMWGWFGRKSAVS